MRPAPTTQMFFMDIPPSGLYTLLRIKPRA
jgi:hypothetical protein